MDSEILTIDYMQQEDIPFIREIEKQCFSELWPEDGFERELTNTKVALYLVLKIDGTVAGYMGSWLILEEAHITTFAVAPKFQGKKNCYTAAAQIYERVNLQRRKMEHA